MAGRGRHAALAAAVLRLLASGPAWGVEIWVRGAGAESCGTWESDLGSNAALQDHNWVLGYLSGRAFESGIDILRTTDYQAMVQWMNNYCAGHPLDMIAQAADVLFSNLTSRSRN